MSEQIHEQTGTLVFSRTINSPAAQIYHAFTNATALREWMCDFATLVPRVGGRLYLAWNNGFYSSGEFTALEVDSSVAFTWFGRGDPHTTQVQVTISSQNGSTQVQIEQSGHGSGEAWAAVVREQSRGWELGLDNLKSILETGEDLRLTRRPMLGITVSDYNSEIAQKLGVPTKEGLRLDSTLAEMGAHAAGLQKDDVIVVLGDRQIRDFNDLASALQGRFAGEQVEVSFYRGAEKRTVTMELSGRPIPEIPKNGRELAAIVQEKYDQIDSELADIFRDVPEEEAGQKPAADEWSAKDVLAHMIVSERFSSTYIVELVNSQERWSDDFPGNNDEQIQSVVKAYPTVKDLLEELKRNEMETVSLLETLTEEFINRKGSYWRLAYGSIQPDYHAELHYGQIRAAIEAARKK
jgi:uncharacterized protein YndB with AHSA1/START domain